MKKYHRQLRVIPIVFLCLILTLSPMLSVSATEGVQNTMLSDNNIPVINITIDESAEGFGTIEEMNASPDHSVNCTGSVKIIVPEGYTGDYSDTVLSDTKELKLDYIRGRGNTTWNLPKKPYKFKLDKKADLLGMGKNKHWVLMANYNDITLLRNRLISYMGTQIGLAYTPKMLPVDVVMNGEYLGSYYLAEQVRVGDTRVDIDELTSEDNDEPEITGGYLIGMNPYEDEPELNRFKTERGAEFVFDTPEFASDDPTDEVGTPEQKAYITDYLQKVEDAIYNGNPEDYMDMQSAADYWWVQTYSYNFDAYFTPSTYLYKPRNDKLYWGPLWDFDISLGRPTGDIEGYSRRETPWLDQLRENNAEFRQLLIERWTVLDRIITDIVKDGGVLDTYKAEIKSSWVDNLPFTNNPDTELDYEIENLRTWMTERQEWINSNLDGIGKAYCKVTFMVDGNIVEQKKVVTGQSISTMPEAPKKDGYLFIGWELNGEPFNLYSYLAFWEDTIITARYLSDDDAIHAQNIYFSGYDVWSDINEHYPYYSSCTFTPDDAQEKDVTWTSSDTNIAEVAKDGGVTKKQVGEVTITATLRNGLSKSYTLHIYDGNVTPLNEPKSITLENSTIFMKVGEYTQIVATVSPQPCESTLTFSGSDHEDEEGIVDVIGDGVIKALAPGTTTVTVSLEDLKEVCTIIVTDGEEPTEEPTQAPTESAATPDSASPAQAATEAKSSTTGGSTTAGGGSVATGENTIVPILLIMIIAAAGIALYDCSYRRKKIK